MKHHHAVAKAAREQRARVAHGVVERAARERMMELEPEELDVAWEVLEDGEFEAVQFHCIHYRNPARKTVPAWAAWLAYHLWLRSGSNPRESDRTNGGTIRRAMMWAAAQDRPAEGARAIMMVFIERDYSLSAVSAFLNDQGPPWWEGARDARLAR